MHLNSLVRVNPSLYVVTTADCLFSKLRLFSKTHCVYIKLKNAPSQSVVSNAFSGIWDLGSGVIKTRDIQITVSPVEATNAQCQTLIWKRFALTQKSLMLNIPVVTFTQRLWRAVLEYCKNQVSTLSLFCPYRRRRSRRRRSKLSTNGFLFIHGGNGTPVTTSFD